MTKYAGKAFINFIVGSNPELTKRLNKNKSLASTPRKSNNF